jgi:hypothetical protein
MQATIRDCSSLLQYTALVAPLHASAGQTLEGAYPPFRPFEGGWQVPTWCGPRFRSSVALYERLKNCQGVIGKSGVIRCAVWLVPIGGRNVLRALTAKDRAIAFLRRVLAAGTRPVREIAQEA